MTCPDRQPLRPWADVRPAVLASGAAVDPEQSAQLAFLDEAEVAGFSPRVDRWGPFAASAGARQVFIIRRMRERLPEDVLPRWRHRWELCLTDGHGTAVRSAMSGFVLGFEATAAFAIRWLRGDDEAALWVDLRAVSTHRSRHGEWIDLVTSSAT